MAKIKGGFWRITTEPQFLYNLVPYSNFEKSVLLQHSEQEYHEGVINECKRYLRESGVLQKEKIILWAESLEALPDE